MDVTAGITTKRTRSTIIGILLLVFALAGAVINLPAFLYLYEQSTEVKVIWRFMLLIILLLPWVVNDILDNIHRFPEFFTKNISHILLHSFILCIYIYLVYYAVRETFVAHTLLLCSMSTTFSTVWKFIRSMPFTKLEYIGVAANVFGAYLCCCEGATVFRGEIASKSSIQLLFNAFFRN